MGLEVPVLGSFGLPLFPVIDSDGGDVVAPCIARQIDVIVAVPLVLCTHQIANPTPFPRVCNNPSSPDSFVAAKSHLNLWIGDHVGKPIRSRTAARNEIDGLADYSKPQFDNMVATTAPSSCDYIATITFDVLLEPLFVCRLQKVFTSMSVDTVRTLDEERHLLRPKLRPRADIPSLDSADLPNR